MRCSRKVANDVTYCAVPRIGFFTVKRNGDMTVPSKGRQWKRCGIYCIYAKYGHVARYVDYFLSKLVKSLDQLVIVANGELDADS